MRAVHLIIKGKVQGVFFRASTRDKAVELGISGWVKNTKEGNVEILATGTQENLSSFIEWCKIGPPSALVMEVEVSNVFEAEFKSFSIIR